MIDTLGRVFALYLLARFFREGSGSIRRRLRPARGSWGTITYGAFYSAQRGGRVVGPLWTVGRA
jgi:hypothetical protein